MLPLSSLFTSIKRTTHQLIIHRVVTPLPQLSSSPRTHPDFHAHIHTPTRSRLSSCHPCCPFQPSSQQSFGFRYWLFRRSISYSSSLGTSSITFSTPHSLTPFARRYLSSSSLSSLQQSLSSHALAPPGEPNWPAGLQAPPWLPAPSLARGNSRPNNWLVPVQALLLQLPQQHQPLLDPEEADEHGEPQVKYPLDPYPPT